MKRAANAPTQGSRHGGELFSRLQREEEADLTEVAAPRPAQPDPSDGRHQPGILENAGTEAVTRTRPTHTQSPAQSEADANDDWRQQHHLEAAEKEEEETPLPAEPASSSAWLTQLYTISYLIFFSLWGVLARLGVQWITFYPGAPVVIANLWANVGGSFLMGFLSEDRNLFREEWGLLSTKQAAGRPDDAAQKAHAKVKKTIPLYIGLTVGFCGSFTSFSTFLRDVFDATANDLPAPAYHTRIAPALITQTVPRNGGYSFEALLAIVLLTVGMSLSAHVFGSHVALGLDPMTPTIPFRLARNVLDPLVAVLGWGCWLGVVFMAIWPPDRPGGPVSAGSWQNEHWRGEALFALVFAPVGCLLRFVLSVKLNALVPPFPLGTFAANMFGVAVLSMSHDLQRVPLVGGFIGGGQVGCQVLQGIVDGFCGALTTVSTWVAELRSLQRRHAYFYGMTSIAVGFSLTVVIMGSVRWTIGYSSTVCQVETT